MGIWEYQYTDELYHHGIKGQKWGIRRYQDEDGRYTAAGKRRYLDDKTEKVRTKMNSYAPYTKTGIKTKSGKVALTKSDVNDKMRSLKTVQASKEKKYGEKYDRKQRAQEWRHMSRAAKKAIRKSDEYSDYERDKDRWFYGPLGKMTINKLTENGMDKNGARAIGYLADTSLALLGAAVINAGMRQMYNQ